MTAKIRNKPGAEAIGVLAEEAGGRWRATFTARHGDDEDIRGPEYFTEQDAAANWVLNQAVHHGFALEDFELVVQPWAPLPGTPPKG